MLHTLIGIGSSLGSIPLAATLSWIIKDGLGQLGKTIVVISDHDVIA